VQLAGFDQPWGNPAQYSAAICVGELIFTSGHLGAVPRGATVPFSEQVGLSLERLIESVEAAGGGLDTIVKITTYLASLDEFAEYDKIYRSLITTSPMPARTTVQAGSLTPPVRIEVECVATVRRC
jgi:2-iminobutanoate/2-iminopropanoate deaminase